MIGNYFNIALRIFRKHPLFTVINIFGLTMGISCALFVFLWVLDELAFDRFHQHTDNLYQLIREESYPDGSFEYLTATPGLMGPTLEKDHAEIINSCRVGYSAEYSVKFDDKSLTRSMRFVDASFFRMFSHPVAAGSTVNAFHGPEEAIISASTARAIFGNDDPIGKSFHMSDAEFSFDLKIIAVMEDFRNTFIEGTDILIPYQAMAARREGLLEWGGNMLSLFVQVTPGTNIEHLNQAIADVVRRNTTNETYDVYLQPLSERHLYGDIEPVRQATGRIVYVRLFSVIACFVLVIACINFINLVTARSFTRVREVGVRKASGAVKKQLTGQFLLEVGVLALTSLLFGLLVTTISMPWFNQLTGKDLSTPWSNPLFYLLLTLILVVTTLLAGSYPAQYLASLKPVAALAGRLSGNGLILPVRKVLVVFQFTLSIMLMIGALVVYQQVDYFKNKNLGIDQENVIYFNTTKEIQSRQETFALQLKNHPSVVSTTFTAFLPTNVRFDTSSPSWQGKDPNDKIDFQILFSGLDFTNTNKIEILEGRDFNSLADSGKVLINTTAADIMGLDQIIGEQLTIWGNDYEIIGVMDDFNSRSLHVPVMPLILWLQPEYSQYVMVRIAPDNVSGSIAAIEEVYSNFSSGTSFDYHFLDATIEATYHNEETIGRLAAIFTVLAIGISTLGLFGLAAFNFERRKKEAGIRKALGANSTQIIYLFSIDFLKLVMMALLIAAPLSWLLSTEWLRQFYFHTEFNWLLVLLAGVMALLIAFCTVGWHAFRAHLENPVNALRYE